MSAAFHFMGLTPDTILDAIESIGIYPQTGLMPLNSFENRVYQFRCDRGNRYVAKFYRPQRWQTDQILEEHAFAFELQAAGVVVAAPTRLDGQSLFRCGECHFALFPAMVGRPFEVDNLDQLDALGGQLGRLHRQARQGDFCHRLPLKPSAEDWQSLPVLVANGHVTAHLADDFLQSAEALLRSIEEHWVETRSQRLHGDLHPGNILWTGDGVGLVDLDDACSGPAVQDLWMMLAGDNLDRRVQLDTLLSAYEEHCPFDMQELGLIEPLRGLRMLRHMAWIAHRWEDPAFPRHFPWFTEEAYWQRQIRDMQAQRQQILAPPLNLQPF